MLKRLLLSLLITLATLPAIARDFQYTYEGQTITYTVIDEDAKTCMTKGGYVSTSIETGHTDIKGSLLIPSTPKDGETEYTLIKIGEYSFYACTNITSIEIPNSVTSIENSAFRGCENLASVVVPNSVSFLGDSSFAWCTSLTTVELPNSITEIRYGTFSTCISLKTITFPQSVTKIGNYAFQNCSALVSLEIPQTVIEIGSAAFSMCRSLKTIKLPYGITTINNSLFKDCTSLSSIEIPESVYAIDYYAFYNCESLTAIKIPESVTTIEENTFWNCSSLSSVILPSSLTSIGFHAFQLCTSLQSIDIPDSVTLIDDAAFNDCTSLVSVHIPKKVLTIAQGAFAGCLAMESFFVEHDNPNYSSINGVLFNKDASILVQYPSGNSNTSYVVPNSVVTIGYGAFYGSSNLISITIPASVTSFGTLCFSKCDSLTCITVTGDGNTLPRFGITPFDNSQYKTINVYFDSPSLALAAREDANWSQFTHITYSNGTDNFASVQWDLPLLVSGVENVEFSGCMTEEGEALTLHCLYNDDVAMYVGDNDVTAALFSPEGYTLTVDPVWDNNKITVYPRSKARSVFLTETGTLFDELGLQDLQNIEALTVIGPINSIDLMTINRMVRLKYLNLRGAQIVEGGNTNREETANNTLSVNMFSGNKDLLVFVMPESVTDVADGAFGGMDNLRSITLNRNITELSGDLFAGCNSLTVLNIPTTVSRLETQALKNCKNMQFMVFETSDEPIDISGSMTDISVRDIILGRPYEGQPFIGHKTLTSIIYTNNLPVNADEFANCQSLESVVFDASQNELGANAFKNCTSLKSVELSNQINDIPSGTFSGCSALQTVKLGSAVKTISDDAFAGCSAISEIHCYAEVPPVISEAVFSAVDKTKCHLVVPQGSLVYYWLDPIWKEFLNMSANVLYLSPLPNVTYGDGPVDLAQYAPADVILTYESSNPEVIRIDGTIATIVGAGEATIGAIAAEDGTPMEIIGQMRQFFVDQADLLISVEDMEITEGEDIPEFVYTAIGLCYDDQISDICELPNVYCEAGPHSAPGEYTIEVRGGNDKNYRIQTATAKLIIHKKTESAIDNIETEQTSNVYNLQGVKIVVESLDELPAGIYIVNGKKTRI